MSKLIVRTITGIIFVTAVVVCFLRPLTMVLLFSMITALTLWEYCSLVNNVKGVRVNRFICTVAGVYLFLAVSGFCSGVVPTAAVFVPYLLTVIYLFISELYVKSENTVNNWAYAMLSQMYVALPLSTVNVMAFNAAPGGLVHYNNLLPLCVFIFLWANDTGAYCCGSLLGRHKLFPRISPGKTWEGSAGGALFVAVAAVLVSHFADGGGNEPSMLTIPQWLGLGLVVTLFGTWGDLVESLFKRTLGIKDSGRILPGHGGMLDRFDSSLMAMPAAVIYLYTLTLA